MRPKKQGRGWMSLCPTHDDTNRSLSSSEGQGGKVLAKCFGGGGCSFKNIRDALGLGKDPPSTNGRAPRKAKRPDTPPEPQPLPTGRTLTHYIYTDPSSTPVLAVVRRDYQNGDKTFSQWTPAEKPGLWIPKGYGPGAPLFRRPTLDLGGPCNGRRGREVREFQRGRLAREPSHLLGRWHRGMEQNRLGAASRSSRQSRGRRRRPEQGRRVARA